jgi:steroid delta-isomerase-like uncharacterized protein
VWVRETPEERGIEELTVSAEENKDIVHRLFENLSPEGYKAIVEELVAPSCVYHAPPFPDMVGPEGFKQFLEGTFTAYPDAEFTVEDMLAEEDKVAVRLKLRGTHKGVTRTGIAPTGKRVTGTGIEVYCLDKGKIVEKWMNFDFLGLMQQMGASPAPK